MSWRLAASLEVLRNQINDAAPGRKTDSDGTIGDERHRHRPSRHNPNGAGVVCALDVTDDPANGCPIHVIAEHIRSAPHPDLDYIISNGRIAGRSTAWGWRAYTGKNPHTRHAHFGVGSGPDGEPGPSYDDTTPWNVSGNGAAAGAAPVTAAAPRTLRKGSRGQDVAGLQQILIGAGLLAADGADGVFGPVTEAAVRQLQSQLGVEADGVVGPRTHAAIANLLAWLASH